MSAIVSDVGRHADHVGTAGLRKVERDGRLTLVVSVLDLLSREADELGREVGEVGVLARPKLHIGKALDNDLRVRFVSRDAKVDDVSGHNPNAVGHRSTAMKTGVATPLRTTSAVTVPLAARLAAGTRTAVFGPMLSKFETHKFPSRSNSTD